MLIDRAFFDDSEPCIDGPSDELMLDARRDPTLQLGDESVGQGCSHQAANFLNP